MILVDIVFNFLSLNIIKLKSKIYTLTWEETYTNYDLNKMLTLSR